MTIYSLQIADLATAVQACAHAMPKRDIRGYLNGLRFQINGAELHLIASDGHRLAHATVACSDKSNSPDFTLAEPDVKRFAQHLQAMAKCGVTTTDLMPDMDSGALYVHDSSGVRHPFMMLRGDGGQPETHYPDWRRVMFKPGAQGYDPSARTDGELFNSEYLADAYKACSIVCKGMKFSSSRTLLAGGVNGQQKAWIHVSANGVEFETTIMGLRD